MEQDLVAIESDCSEALDRVEELDSLNDLRVQYLGRQGRLTAIMRGLGKLAKEDRKAFGQAANKVRDRLNQAFAQAEDRLKKAALAAELAERIDLTLPGSDTAVRGRVHPLRRVESEILGIFNRLGYRIASGPQVEDDWHRGTGHSGYRFAGSSGWLHAEKCNHLTIDGMTMNGSGHWWWGQFPYDN